MQNDRRVTVVGGIPDPVGGVTTFVRRMASALPDMVASVIDIYPCAHKEKVAVSLQVVERPVLFRLYFRFLFSVRGPVYFNFSGAKALLLLALLPKVPGSRWALTLHNGDVGRQLEKYGRLAGVVGSVMSRGLSKCDVVGVISGKQRQFFVGLRAPEHKLMNIAPFFGIPAAVSTAASSPEVVQLEEWRASGKTVVVASGYPTEIYRHERLLDRFDQLWSSGVDSLRLVLFLYGDDHEGALRRISERVKGNPFAVCYWRSSEDVFLAALAEASAYVRMNSVDSYGVAVAEAICLGTPVLATNVCARYPGATLVDVDDFDALEQFVLDLPAPPKLEGRVGNGVAEMLERLVGAP